MPNKPFNFKEVTFVLSGNFYTRISEVAKKIERHGGYVRSHVSSLTNILVCGKKPGDKVVQSAKDQKVEFWTEAQLLCKLAEADEERKNSLTLPYNRDEPSLDRETFAGKTIVLGGVLVKWHKLKLRQFLAEQGGMVRETISSLTNVVIIGQRAGPKMMERARANGALIVKETDLYTAVLNGSFETSIDVTQLEKPTPLPRTFQPPQTLNRPKIDPNPPLAPEPRHGTKLSPRVVPCQGDTASEAVSESGSLAPSKMDMDIDYDSEATESDPEVLSPRKRQICYGWL